MCKNRPSPEAGMTLLEVTMALAFFAVVIGITATSLGSFYMNLDVQEQKVEAAQVCRAVLDGLREKRAEFVDLDDGTSDFPLGLAGWVEDQNEENWPNYLVRTREIVVDGEEKTVEELSEQAIMVQMSAPDGGAVTAATNPVLVRVMTTWEDRQGRSMQTELATLLADR